MSTPILTIVVPTYNRARRLDLLLTTLARELDGLDDLVSVIVADNASPDDTPAVIASFAATRTDTVTFRHAVNVGPDENFCRCVERVVTRYFWLIGDDDLPKAGTIRLVVELLRRESPDLVYIESDPRDEIVDNEPDRPVVDLRCIAMSRLGFARRVQVYSTFISGMVVHCEAYRATADAADLRRFTGTNLVQLGWVLALLKEGKRFLLVRQGCILSKQGNSGGYSLLTVFGKNFPVVVAEALGAHSRMTKAIVRRCIIGHLTEMVYRLRFSSLGDFQYENVGSILRPALGSYLGYWLLIEPVSRMPMRWANRLARVAGKLARALAHYDRIREERSVRTESKATRSRSSADRVA